MNTFNKICHVILKNKKKLRKHYSVMWHHSALVVTTIKLHSIKLDIRFCPCSNYVHWVNLLFLHPTFFYKNNLSFIIMNRTKLKNGQHHHEKLKFDFGLTCVVFSLEGTLNVVFLYLKYFSSTFGS